MSEFRAGKECASALHCSVYFILGWFKGPGCFLHISRAG